MMIDIVTLETAHLSGDSLPAMHRLRYRLFVQRQGYDVPTYRDMEWDQFDTPAAVYLLWRDERGEPRAMARLLPTTFPYMVKVLWPQLVTREALPSEPRVWELTRYGVDKELSPETRARALGELLCGCIEYCLREGIERLIHVAHPQIIQTVLLNAGCTVDFLGERQKLGRITVICGRLHITRRGLVRARRHRGITQPVLKVAGDGAQRAA